MKSQKIPIGMKVPKNTVAGKKNRIEENPFGKRGWALSDVRSRATIMPRLIIG